MSECRGKTAPGTFSPTRFIFRNPHDFASFAPAEQSIVPEPESLPKVVVPADSNKGRRVPITRASALATRKGFTLSKTGLANRYRLLDCPTGLPQLNMPAAVLDFTLDEVLTFLAPLPHRAARRT